MVYDLREVEVHPHHKEVMEGISQHLLRGRNEALKNWFENKENMFYDTDTDLSKTLKLMLLNNIDRELKNSSAPYNRKDSGVLMVVLYKQYFRLKMSALACLRITFFVNSNNGYT